MIFYFGGINAHAMVLKMFCLALRWRIVRVFSKIYISFGLG